MPASGQVSWLSDRPTPHAFPAHRASGTVVGFVPDHSDGVAADSHRLPWGPRPAGRPDTANATDSNNPALPGQASSRGNLRRNASLLATRGREARGKRLGGGGLLLTFWGRHCFDEADPELALAGEHAERRRRLARRDAHLAGDLGGRNRTLPADESQNFRVGLPPPIVRVHERLLETRALVPWRSNSSAIGTGDHSDRHDAIDLRATAKADARSGSAQRMGNRGASPRSVREAIDLPAVALRGTTSARST